MPNFAANLSLMFTEVSFLDRFAAARAAGFDAVEFLFPYAHEAEQIAQRLARAQLQLVLFNLPAGDWAGGERGLACDPRRVAEFRASVDTALEYALELGVTQMHCLAGILPPRVSRERAHATYIDNLRHACARLRPHGMTVLIEPINQFDMPGYFLSGSKLAAAVIAECGADNLALQCDLYHLQRSEGELAATLRQQLPLIRHVQIADNPGRHEPGTGEINYRFLFDLLDRLGYQGWVGCEYHPAGDTVAGLGWRTALAPGKQTQQ